MFFSQNTIPIMMDTDEFQCNLEIPCKFLSDDIKSHSSNYQKLISYRKRRLLRSKIDTFPTVLGENTPIKRRKKSVDNVYCNGVITR